MSDGRSDKRVCLLTGAGGRLGTAFCTTCRGDYEIVAVHGTRRPPVPDQHARHVDPLDPGAALPERDRPVFAIAADLTADGEIERVVELALARYGRVDLLVNAAVHAIWAPIVDAGALLASVDRQLETNVAVPLRLSAALAAASWRDRRAENLAANRSIVNLSSLAGAHVFPGQGQSVYAASKAALDMLTRHMALEFAAFGVRVNALAPDSFPTRVATERVVAEILALDRGSDSGAVIELPADAAAATETASATVPVSAPSRA